MAPTVIEARVLRTVIGARWVAPSVDAGAMRSC